MEMKYSQANTVNSMQREKIDICCNVLHGSGQGNNLILVSAETFCNWECKILTANRK